MLRFTYKTLIWLLSLRIRTLGGEKLELFCQAEKIPFQFGVPAVNRPNPGHDDNIVAGGEPVLLQAVDFPQPAAHSVPDHRVAQLGSRGQAQPVFPPAVFPAVQNHGGRNRAPALGVEPAEHSVFL